MAEASEDRPSSSASETWRYAEARRAEFDASAAAYDRWRPRYPEALFDDLVDLAGLEPGDRVVEIGAGTGIASLPLAERGLDVLALEPAVEMGKLAHRKLSGQGLVLNTRFEDLELKEPVKLVSGFNSWHWIEPEQGLKQLVSTLAPRGHVGLVWTDVVQWGEEPFLSRMAEEVGWRPGPSTMSHVLNSLDPLRSSSHFTDWSERRYRFERALSADDYVAVTRTYGQLPDPSWEEAVRRVVERNLGGSLTKVEDAVLYGARRSDDGER